MVSPEEVAENWGAYWAYVVLALLLVVIGVSPRWIIDWKIGLPAWSLFVVWGAGVAAYFGVDW